MSNNTQKIQRRIQVMLSEGEQKMFSDLSGRFACGVSELVKEWLRYNHRKNFPAYGSKKSRTIVEHEEQLTPEQVCGKWGGRVEQRNGFPVCLFVRPGTQNGRALPMSMVKDFEEVAINLGIIK